MLVLGGESVAAGSQSLKMFDVVGNLCLMRKIRLVSSL